MTFLCHNDISFTSLGCNKQVYIGINTDGERQYKKKKFLC